MTFYNRGIAYNSAVHSYNGEYVGPEVPGEVEVEFLPGAVESDSPATYYHAVVVTATNHVVEVSVE